MGALLGALITGGIAISVFLYQNYLEKKKEKEHHKKVYYNIRKPLKLISDSIPTLQEKLSEELIFNASEILTYKNLFDIASKLIDGVEAKDMPIDLLESYLKIKDSIDGFKIYISAIEERQKLNGFFKQEFLDDIEVFIKYYKQLEEYFK